MPWQLLQPEVIPVWFIVHCAKPPVTVVLVWQLSQAAAVGMCAAPVGFVTSAGVPARKLAPLAWQLAQAVPATTAWFMLQLLKPLGVLVLVWHWSQAAVVAMWPLAGLVTTTVLPAKLFPVSWQLAHAAPATCVWSIVQLAKPPGTVVLAWQLEHSALVTMWFAGLPMTVARLEAPMLWLPLALWQLEHAVPATSAWFMDSGVAKLRLVNAWQASQDVVPVGTWPAITAMPGPAAPWQLRHLPLSAALCV